MDNFNILLFLLFHYDVYINCVVLMSLVFFYHTVISVNVNAYRRSDYHNNNNNNNNNIQYLYSAL